MEWRRSGIFSRRAGVLGDAVARRLPSARAGRVTSGVVEGLQRYAPERRILSIVLAASIAVQILRCSRRIVSAAHWASSCPCTTYFAIHPDHSAA